jgi:5-methylcytosine-specific restriction endonuclease McrA
MMASDPTLGTKRFRDLRQQVIHEETHCWLCHQPVSRNLRYPHPKSAAIDHVTPRSHGGDPYDRNNLRLAHFDCNSSRGNRPPSSIIATTQQW